MDYCDNMEVLKNIGRIIECSVFVCVVKWYLEDCVIVYENKIIVFN